jgi:hypothetical protein
MNRRVEIVLTKMSHFGRSAQRSQQRFEVSTLPGRPKNAYRSQRVAENDSHLWNVVSFVLTTFNIPPEAQGGEKLHEQIDEASSRLGWRSVLPLPSTGML